MSKFSQKFPANDLTIFHTHMGFLFLGCQEKRKRLGELRFSIEKLGLCLVMTKTTVGWVKKKDYTTQLYGDIIYKPIYLDVHGSDRI